MNKIKVSKKDIDINNKLYKEYERLRMEDGWNEGDKDRVYKKLLKISEITKTSFFNSSVLDVGCGTGDLSALLRRRNIGEYIGVDIYKPAIELSRTKYPKENFIIGDILNEILVDKKYDFVFCSGGLTTNFDTDNYVFLEAMLQKMLKLTKVGLVFNLLSDEDKDPDPDLFFYNIEKVIYICKRIAPSSIIHIEKNSVSFQTHFYIHR